MCILHAFKLLDLTSFTSPSEEDITMTSTMATTVDQAEEAGIEKLHCFSQLQAKILESSKVTHKDVSSREGIYIESFYSIDQLDKLV